VQVAVARAATQCPHNTAKTHKVQCNASLYVCLTCAGGGGQGSSTVPTEDGTRGSGGQSLVQTLVQLHGQDTASRYGYTVYVCVFALVWVGGCVGKIVSVSVCVGGSLLLCRGNKLYLIYGVCVWDFINWKYLHMVWHVGLATIIMCL